MGQSSRWGGASCIGRVWPQTPQRCAARHLLLCIVHGALLINRFATQGACFTQAVAGELERAPRV
eukprot:15443849-Alexandrium_andersonii.AAC.1